EQQATRDPGRFDWSRYQNTGGWQQYGGGGNAGFGGEEHFSDFFERIFGEGFNTRGGRRRASAQKGEDYQAEVELSLEEAYKGATRLLEVHGETLQMKFKGVKDGQKLKIRGKGGPGINGGERGDIYIRVHITPHPVFERKGDDLYAELPVDLYTAVLGGQAILHTLSGPVKIPVVKGTDNGKVLRLKNMGMPEFGKEKEFGDLYAWVNIVLPQKLSDRELELFRQLSNLKK
ncbi:MAG: J domain-containing protein, partial [Daejeonella sp.]